MIWGELVGQEHVVGTLTRAVDAARDGGSAMTHAWLFTGPPGSGRSTAALAFAAALQCDQGGCGSCSSCTQAAAGSHPDITRITTDGLSISVAQVREIVRKAALHPASSPWQIIVIEDADRLTDTAANALLKSIEEPAAHTLWLLCAPATEDVITTIRSRCRSVVLRTPSTSAIAELLASRDGIERELAVASAAASQGHIGRARGLARDEAARARRREILALPVGLHHLGDCIAAAKRIDEEATLRAAARCDALDEQEKRDLAQSWGVDTEQRGKRPGGYAGALSALTKDQERRRKRMARDFIDGVLLDLLSFWRDVLAVRLGAIDLDAPQGTSMLINADALDSVRAAADQHTNESALQAIDAVVACRSAITANAAPQLALEHLMTRFLP